MAACQKEDTLSRFGLNKIIAQFKKLFDPDGRLNPGKVLPTGHGCLEIRQRPLSARTVV